MLLSIALLAQLAPAAYALRTDGQPFGWRQLCGVFDESQRIDPIVSPNEPATHAHVFHGSSRFSASANYTDIRDAECTSCEPKEDKSSYWVPPLYFQGADGKYTKVNQIGGLLVYYWNRDDHTKAFPEGFRMVAGDPNRNVSTLHVPDIETSFRFGEEQGEAKNRERALGFNCLNYLSGKNEDFLFRHQFPDPEKMRECVDGLRIEVAFPQCWDGKNVDSPDHKSHVHYPTFVQDGTCPEDFPVRLPGIAYETTWDVNAFRDQPGQFVLANGDYTGLGNHADFMNGWDPAFLQSAMDSCVNNDGNIENCKMLTLQPIDKCKAENVKPLAALRHEVCDGIVDQLCGKAAAADVGVAVDTVQPTVATHFGGDVAVSTQARVIPVDTPAPAPPAPAPVETPAPPPPAPPAPPAVSAPPQVSTIIEHVEITVYEDVWTTVYAKEKRHGHHHHRHV